MKEIKNFLAPAKINLVLHILFRHKNGYHELFTIFQKITLFDELEISLAEDISIEVKGDIHVPAGKDNLCIKAAQLFFEASGLSGGVRIKLYKNIPVGAGLGGGSSDAGAVLKALNDLYQKPLSETELLRIAREVGADVPFFVSPYSTALAKGIGDVLSPWPTHPAWYILVFPGIKISTSWAYQNLRLTTCLEPPNYDPARPLWTQGLVNDFEQVIFEIYPLLKKIKEILLNLDADAALLSGSGSTVFGIFRSRSRAKEAEIAMREQEFNCVTVTNYIGGQESCL